MLVLQLISTIAEWSARFILIGAVCVAPWLLGSVPAQFQLWLVYGVAASFVLWFVGTVVAKGARGTGNNVVVPLPLILLLLLVGVGIVQVALPWSSTSISSEWAATLQAGESSPSEILPNAAHVTSILPYSTRFQIARILIVAAAIFLGAQLFRTHVHFLWLFGALAMVGALQALFGIEQILQASEKFLGFIALRYGGDPFATFVNRNNAAGFLNICLAASIGGMILTSGRRFREYSSLLVIVFATLGALTMAGVVASTSRGGMVATAIGLVTISPWLFRQFGTWSLVGTACAVGSVIVLATWFHFADAATNRMETLKDLSTAMSGRWEHWEDTSVLLFDRPWLGSGWGTYRYANLPYQRQATTAWFWNADNQFFEVLVEGGFVGLILMLGCLVSFGLMLVYLIRHGSSSFTRALVASGLFLLVSLTVQGTTDFGISLLSLALACGVLVGAFSGAAMRLKPVQTEMRIPFRLLTSRFAVTTATLVLVAGTGWAGLEFTRTERSLTLREQVPGRLNAPDLLDMESLNKLISQMQKQAEFSPGNAELHFDLARLLIYRAQQEYTDQIAAGAAAKERIQAWESVQPERLFDLSMRQTGPEWLDETRDRPFFRDNLPVALHELQLARSASAWIPGVSFRLVLLEALSSNATAPQILPETPNVLLRCEALLAAGDPSRLIGVGRRALKDELDPLATLCWRRAVQQDRRNLKRIVQDARLGWEDEQIALRLFDTPEQLVAFSAMTRDIAARQAISRQLERHQTELQLSQRNSKPGQAAWIAAQIALLAEQKAVAIDHFQSAVKHEPFQIQWRLELAELLMDNEDYAGAREQLVFASRLEPRNDNIKKRLETVVECELRARSVRSQSLVPRVWGRACLHRCEQRTLLTATNVHVLIYRSIVSDSSTIFEFPEEDGQWPLSGMAIPASAS